MKRLTCEMCGSTDIIKQDGVFVCQACGCKYSVEEAKKMMVEGTVEVTGTVKVDNSDELKNLFTLARRAKASNDNENAKTYYSRILEKQPSNWEAAFYTPYFTARTSTLAELETNANNVSNCLVSVAKLVAILPEDQREAVVKEIHEAVFGLGSLYLNASIERAKNYRDAAVAFEKFTNGSKATHNMILSLGYFCESFKKYDYAKFCFSSILSTDARLATAGAINAARNEMERIKILESEEKITKQKRIDAYWAEHAEEKAALGAEKAELQRKISTLNARVVELDKPIAKSEKEERAKLRDKMVALNDEYKHLGLFSGKRKKEIQSQLSELENKAGEIEKEIGAKIAERDAKIKAETDALHEQMKLLYARMAEIDAEMTKER